jgi:TATA-box binding protein (TBP) (component of TFIID and TFIIIB)
MKLPNLRIVNTIYASSLPFKRKLTTDEINILMKESRLNFNFCNENNGGLITIKIPREHSEKFANALLWLNGSISINGVQSEDEAKEDLKKIIKELKNLLDIF